MEENWKSSFYRVCLKFSVAHGQGIKDDFEQGFKSI